MKKLSYLGFSVLVFLTLSVSSFADNVIKGCKHHVHHFGSEPGSIDIQGSGEEGSAKIAEHREDAKHVLHELAPILGYKVPPSIIRHMTAVDMSGIVANNGHPAPHWIDGLRVLQSVAGASGIYEIVMAGLPSHNQFIRGTNDRWEKLLVYAHVAGHYDFAENHYLSQAQKNDRVRSTFELAELIGRLKTTHDKDQVFAFYHASHTLKTLQDYARGIRFDPPESFLPKAFDRRPVWKDGKMVIPQVEHPEQPTHAILQAAVENLSPTIEPWKKEILRLTELSDREYPAAVHTKIMNEGWATLAEYLILSHSQHVSSDDLIKFGNINAKVLAPSLSNPYWLGVRCWERIRERFLAQPEIKKLTPLEQTQKFIQEGHRIMSRMRDHEFLRYGLDATFVRKYKLLLKTKHHEDEEKVYNLAVTTDPDRIVRYLANKFGNKEMSFPTIVQTSFNYRQQGEVHYKHEAVRNIPLNWGGAVKAMYQLANQIYERPVRLSTFAMQPWVTPDPTKDPKNWKVDETTKHPVYIGPKPDPVDPMGMVDMDIVVTPDGKVMVESTAKTPYNTAALEKTMQQVLDNFVFDNNLSYTDVNSDVDLSKISKRLEPYVQPIAESFARVFSQTPYAAEAARETTTLLTSRIAKKVSLLAQGKLPIEFSKSGKSFQVRPFPEIPGFNLHSKYVEIRKSLLPPTRHDPAWTSVNGMPIPVDNNPQRAITKSVVADDRSPDEDLDIGVGPYEAGEIWGEKKNPQQEQDPQDGDGDGESQEGEEGEDESEGKGNGGQSGEGGGGEGDPGTVQIPLEVLIDILAEQYQLRKMRKTDGDMKRMDWLPQGVEQKSGGNVDWSETAEVAIARGIAVAKKLGIQVPANKLFEFGMKYMTTGDYMVRSWDEEELPDTDAVLFLMRDNSGSVTEQHLALEMKAANVDIKVLSKVHPGLKIVYVIYGTEARIVSKKEFFSIKATGGTKTEVAIDLVSKTAEEKFKPQRFNRYLHMFSDGGDWSANKSAAALKALALKFDHVAFSHVEPPGAMVFDRTLTEAVEPIATEVPEKLSVSRITTDESILQSIATHWGKNAGQPKP